MEQVITQTTVKPQQLIDTVGNRQVTAAIGRTLQVVLVRAGPVSMVEEVSASWSKP